MMMVHHLSYSVVHLLSIPLWYLYALDKLAYDSHYSEMKSHSTLSTLQVPTSSTLEVLCNNAQSLDSVGLVWLLHWSCWIVCTN